MRHSNRRKFAIGAGRLARALDGDMARRLGHASMPATSHYLPVSRQTMRDFCHRYAIYMIYAMELAQKEHGMPGGQQTAGVDGMRGQAGDASGLETPGEGADARLREMGRLLQDVVEALKSGKAPDAWL